MQIAKDTAHVSAHGRLADRDPVGDLLVAQPLGNQPQYRHLTVDERHRHSPMAATRPATSKATGMAAALAPGA